MMSDDTSDYNLKAIHELLLAAFTPEELRRFCEDRPTFRPVVRRFGRPYRLDDMADELITYCETCSSCGFAFTNSFLPALGRSVLTGWLYGVLVVMPVPCTCRSWRP